METKLKVTPEGRTDMWLPTDKENLKDFIRARKPEKIHNFIPTNTMMLGADHEVESVMADIDRAARMAVFTNKTMNMGHALALIFGDAAKGDHEKLECYDIGAITKEQLELV